MKPDESGKREIGKAGNGNLRTVAGLLSIWIGIAGASAPVLSSVSFRLVWEAQPSPGGLTNFVELTNWCFNVYGTTNLGQPMASWPFLAQVTNWNLGPTNPVNGFQYYTSGVFTLAPAQYFVFINVSNFTGEVGPSNPAWNAPVPQPAVGNMIQR